MFLRRCRNVHNLYGAGAAALRKAMLACTEQPPEEAHPKEAEEAEIK